MAGSQADVALIQKHCAKQWKLAEGDVKVRVQSGMKVPGTVVFSCVADRKKAGRDARKIGILQGKAVFTELDAMSRVARAWNYGAKRTVSAAEFAKVMGFLHSERHNSTAIVDPDTLDVFKSTAYPKEANAAALPRELTVDGAPAVQYCVNSSARTIPFTVVTAIVKPDFTVELRKREVAKE